jgi:rhomboid protease GluP
VRVSPTYTLLVANCVIYVYTSIIGGNFLETHTKVLLLLGQVNRFVMQGVYWQLLTAMFVHVNIVHITSNMFFLFIFGLRAEELFREWEFYLIYFGSGLAGNLLTLIAGPYAFMVSAGASGAIFGLFGANTIYLRKILQRPIVDALFYAFIFFMLSVSANVNILAHLGGLLAGLFMGYFIATSGRVIRQKQRVLFIR